MKTALIINFTGNTYHFGCYGTAREIYYQLLDKGYLVNYLTVKVTHGTAFSPEKPSDFFSNKFVQEYYRNNSAIAFSMQESDIVVVNGEGTLHRLRRGSFHLLFMTYFSSNILKKPTYLINHSCFPEGGEDHGKTFGLYKKALAGLKSIVPREQISAEFYTQANIGSTQGFDSLPLYIKRMGLYDARRDNPTSNAILLCGGISYSSATQQQITNILKSLPQDITFRFLLGGKADLAKEEFNIFLEYKKAGLDIKLVEAKTFAEWCEEIATCACLISARFHYSIAAFALGTPCISFPSNTPKVKAIHDMFENNGHIAWDEEYFENLFEKRVQAALQGDFALNDAQRQKIIELAENNYVDIPQATT